MPSPEGKERKVKNVRPPHKPWIPLRPGRATNAALSFYYSDPRSVIPVRQVGRKNDNKSDPNLETMTYGLFSTCERGMRSGIVKRGIQYLFFCTNRKKGRVLTGYYKIGWFHKGPEIIGYSGGGGLVLPDYMLAASEGKFVNPGFPLGELTGYLNGVRLDKRFRTFRYINDQTAGLLLKLLLETPDATKDYLSEIKRLELLNQKGSSKGLVYENWGRNAGFSWADAPHFMGVK